MHLLVKLRVTLFAIVFDLEWLNLRPLQYLLHHRLCNGRKPGKTGIFRVFLDMLVQVFQCPEFLGVSNVRRTLAGKAGDPCHGIIRNFDRVSGTRFIIQCRINTAFLKFFNAKLNGIHINIYTFCYSGIRVPLGFIYKDFSTVNNLSLYCPAST